MADDKIFTEDSHVKVVYKTSPKIAFSLGIMSGVTLIALVALGMMFSLAKEDGSLSKTNSNTNTAKVAGVDTNTAPTPTPTPTAAPTKVDIAVAEDDFIRGDENAPVTLVEYSDFQCPYCGNVAPTIEQLLKDYEGQIKLVYRHYPLISIHPNAQKAAEASECAGEQGKFWELHDKMFANQTALAVDNLKTFAKDLGLNTSQFNDCLDSGKYTSKVNDSVTEGSGYGVQGTPATFVNGTLVSGAQPISAFKSAIDSALAAAGQ